MSSNLPLFAYISARRIGHQAWETILHCSYATSKNKKLIIFYSPFCVNKAFNRLASENVEFIALSNNFEEIQRIFAEKLTPIFQIFQNMRKEEIEQEITEAITIPDPISPRFENDWLGMYFFDEIFSQFKFLKSIPFDEGLWENYMNWLLPIKYFRQLKLKVEMKNEELLKILGLSKSDWFVCLHVRDSSYLGDTYREWLNQNIENYIPAIEYITQKGGYVIRMGDPRMKPAPRLKGIIDYARSPYKSEFNDLYLISQCKFFMGSHSGLRFIPNLFGKPILSVNFYNVLPQDIYPEHLIIFKKVFDIKKNKLLPLKEILDLPNGGWRETDKEYDEAGLVIIENSPEEILQVTKEMFELFKDNGFDKNYSAEQEDFQDYIVDKLNSKFPNAHFPPAGLCRIGTQYYKENWK